MLGIIVGKSSTLSPSAAFTDKKPAKKFESIPQIIAFALDFLFYLW